MDINYNNRYAFSEVYEILNWLGDEYKKKVPKNLLRMFKEERKFGYTPNIDFNKPLDTQVRQETKNIIAYLNYCCWIEDDDKKKLLAMKVNENVKERIIKEQAEKQLQKELRRQNGNVSLNAQIDNELKKINQ